MNKTLLKRRTRERTFCQEYVKDLNGTRSAIAAGYSKKSAHVFASRLLKNVKVKAILARLMKKQADKQEISAEKVLAELSKMGFSNLLDYMSVESGEAYLDLSKMTREQAAAMQEITVDEYTDGRGDGARQVKRTRFKLADKARSLELLGKYLKLFADRVEVTGLENLAETLAAARARVQKA